jgi:SAM-dependent methyltransferase
MSSWSEGYVSDIAYTNNHFKETTPFYLTFAATGLGRDVLALATPRRVLELGIGTGFGFALNAAAYPDTLFEGCDFNPEHISHAHKLAQDAKLSNVILREASFQDMACEAQEGQHDVDLIVLHGILSWVGSDARAAVVETSRKRLRPGGMLYVSYNSMPGGAASAPLHHLIREHAKRANGSSLARAASAVEAMKKMIVADARFFSASEFVRREVEKLSSQDASKLNYVAHEWMNENRTAFHFADVAKMMIDAKLEFVGSATILENMDNLVVPKKMRTMVEEATDPIWKETLRDFACNKSFRRDIYGRGSIRNNRHERSEIAGQTRFTLAVARSQVKLKFDGIQVAGEPIVDALAFATPTYSELISLPSLMKLGEGPISSVLAVLINYGQIFPIFGELKSDFSAAIRFNRMIVNKALSGRFYNFLAAPLVGSGVPATNVELIILAGIERSLNDPTMLSEFVFSAINRIGIRPMAGGAVIDETEKRANISKAVQRFLTETLPVWRFLGICA